MRSLRVRGAVGACAGTDRALSVIMGWHKPGEGLPNHVHFSQEEMFFIVEGTYELTVGAEKIGERVTHTDRAGGVWPRFPVIR
jgi:uncharacterized cupin superfamily protein